VTTAALVIFGVYLAAGFVLRSLIQWFRTGDSGFRGVSGAAGTPQWWAGILFVAALLAGLLGPVAALLGLDPLAALTSPVLQAMGLALAVAGVVATFVTQLQMGSSWRIGVDERERTRLVTRGAFTLVRNPIFTAMGVTGVGLALMVPNVVALAGAATLVVALELQVRVVEEPYLYRIHGADYKTYAGSTGRFLPGLGRVEDSSRIRTSSAKGVN